MAIVEEGDGRKAYEGSKLGRVDGCIGADGQQNGGQKQCWEEVWGRLAWGWTGTCLGRLLATQVPVRWMGAAVLRRRYHESVGSNK